MFKIRREQKEAFKAAAVHDFETEMVRHIERCLPARHAELGEIVVRELIQQGIERAAGHGIVSERGTCIYVHAMLVLGRDFEVDERYARTSAILKHPSLSEWTKAELLFDAIYDAPSPASGHVAEGVP